MIKKYLLFAYGQYYPAGGMGDLHGTYDTIKEAKEIIEEDSLYIEYWEIVEHKTMEIVESE